MSGRSAVRRLLGRATLAAFGAVAGTALAWAVATAHASAAEDPLPLTVITDVVDQTPRMSTLVPAALPVAGELSAPLSVTSASPRIGTTPVGSSPDTVQPQVEEASSPAGQYADTGWPAGVSAGRSSPSPTVTGGVGVRVVAPGPVSRPLGPGATPRDRLGPSRGHGAQRGVVLSLGVPLPATPWAVTTRAVLAPLDTAAAHPADCPAKPPD